MTLGPDSRAKCAIELEGHDIAPYVRAVHLGASVGNLTTVALQLVNVRVELEADVATQALLRLDSERLGDVKVSTLQPHLGDVLIVHCERTLDAAAARRIEEIVTEGTGLPCLVMDNDFAVEVIRQDSASNA